MSFDRHIASVSFGKDSLAMVLLILERGLPLDEVVFYDTGMEFKAILTPATGSFRSWTTTASNTLNFVPHGLSCSICLKSQ